MSSMTVHGDRPANPNGKVPVGRGPVLRNGQRKIEGPLLKNITLSQSWNGCIWQLQHSPEGETQKVPNGHADMLQTYPIHGVKGRDILYQRRDSTVSKSRDSPVSVGSWDRLSSGDRLSNGSERNRFIIGTYDDDSFTTASSNVDSSEQEEDYVTLDRNFFYKRPLKATPLSHHSSMIDLKHNPLYSPKINNEELANQNSPNNRTLPHKKRFRGPMRSLSLMDNDRAVHVNETDLDEVDENGKPIPWTKRNFKRIYDSFMKPKSGTPKSPTKSPSSDWLDAIQSEYVGLRRTDEDVSTSNETESVVETPKGDSKASTLAMPEKLRKRSKSLGELRLFGEENENELEDSEDGSNSDVDGDDFGFLSHPVFVDSSTAMHKAKSQSPHHRILPKRWRSKPRNSTSGTCLWSPEGDSTWCNVSGRKMQLRPISILQLSEIERLTLQKIVLSKIQALDLGCTVVIPKAEKVSARRKKHILSIKRSKSANIGGFIFNDREKEHQAAGLVFGIPLSKCITNDIDLQRKRNSGPLKERKESDVIIHRQGPRKSSSSSHGSTDNLSQNEISFSESQKRNASSDSLSESESSRNTNSSLIDALTLSSNQEYMPPYATGAPQVPHIVKVCFKHIETYGLRVLGIFRVGASKKKIKQLRDEFDSGKDVKLNESHNPHEVGAVLKEYFRDLPEPLLTRDLYSPFVATRGIQDVEKQMSVTRMLITLLPVPNRDTLWSLLQFLFKVNEHSTDAIDENGLTLPGNKMDSTNLATLFGPNILHKAKSTEKEFTVESMERAEERKEVIDVVKFLIDYHQKLFQIPAALHDEILQILLENDPESTEQIMKRLANETGNEADGDTNSSLFDESDASLPHSPNSDITSPFKSTNTLTVHQPLRETKSAEVLTPCSKRRFFYSSSQEEPRKADWHSRGSDVMHPEERPSFHLVIEDIPSTPETRRTPRMSRSQRVKNSPDPSDSEVFSRPHSIHVERPHSELYSTPKTLSIPTPDYMMYYPSANSSRSGSSRESPVRSDSFLRSSYNPPRSGSSSPRVTSSIQRPLNFNRTPEGENEWQKDRWRHWDSISGDGQNEYSQETLV